MKIANSKNIDVSKTLAKYYKMADSNEIFSYVNNLRTQVIVESEPEWYHLSVFFYNLHKYNPYKMMKKSKP